MKKLSIFAATFAVAALSAGQASAGFDNTFVDAQHGTDSGPNDCSVIASPCATLNNALANTNVNGSVNISGPGFFGPVRLTSSVNINALDNQAVIQANDAASPGCVAATPGNCGANSGYALEIAGTTSTNFKLKGISFRQGSGSGGAVKIGTANQIKINNSTLRGSGAATLPMLDIVPANGNCPAGQFQLVLDNVDIAFSNGQAVRILPSGATAVRLLADHLQVHNASAGIRIDSSSLSGAGCNIVGGVVNSAFFSFPNSGINIVANSTSNRGTFAAAVSVFTNTGSGGAALRATGAGAQLQLTNNVVVGNTIGVQVLNGAQVATFSNNSVGGNGTDTDTAGGVVFTKTPF